jgi:hypothetical protein
MLAAFSPISDEIDFTSDLEELLLIELTKSELLSDTDIIVTLSSYSNYCVSMLKIASSSSNFNL